MKVAKKHEKAFYSSSVHGITMDSKVLGDFPSGMTAVHLQEAAVGP